MNRTLIIPSAFETRNGVNTIRLARAMLRNVLEKKKKKGVEVECLTFDRVGEKEKV